MAQKEVEIFKDTMKLCEADTFLSSAIQSSLQGQEIYKETPAIRLNNTGDTVTISVTKNRSFESARKYNKGRICVLNFASFTKAGSGVVIHSTAQEECL